MFQTIQSRLAILASGAWIPGAIMTVEDAYYFFPLLLAGWATIWGGVYGAFWVIEAPATPSGEKLSAQIPVIPKWLRYVLLAVLVIFIMGAPKAIYRLIAGH